MSTVLVCKNCGAEIPIGSPGTVVVTCEHCNTLSYRHAAELELIGEIALPTPLPSRFQLGTEGRFEGRNFVVRGQIQLDHGAGLWNEWAAESEDGWLWIAEAQGEVHVYREVDTALVPTREKLPDADPDTGDFVPPKKKARDRWRAGDSVAAGDGQPWTIREIGRGTVVTFRGELPVKMKPGTRTTYVDLVRGAAEVATLDFTRPGKPELLVGRLVAPSELHLDPSTQPDGDTRRVASQSVTCSNCGGTVEVQDADHAISLGCAHCGAILARENQAGAFRAVEAERRIRTRPDIPIGSVGTIRGEELTVLGFLERSVRADGERYPWREYLARTEEGAYRWLVESDGHWTYVEPVPPTRFKSTGSGLEIGGGKARPFSTGKAKVDEVLGEFYWQVRVGESVETLDYVAPKLGLMASTESAPLESAASLGRHLERSEVADAFPAAKLPKVVGVGPIQPNPAAPRATWTVFLLPVVLLIGSCVTTRVSHANETVYVGSFGPVAATTDTEKAEFSDSFRIPSDGKNVRVSFEAPALSNGYLAFLGALVNEDSGEVTTFQTAAQYYSGTSGGERWSEGNRRGSVLVGPIAAGHYRLRIATRPYDSATNVAYQVAVKSDVPRIGWYFLGLVLLLVVPVIVAIRYFAFEARRWANSDFGTS